MFEAMLATAKATQTKPPGFALIFQDSAATKKYSYINDVSSDSTSLGLARNNFSTAGGLLSAMCFGGGSGITRTDKVAYANESTSTGGAMTIARAYTCATGNAAVAIIGLGLVGGNYNASTDRYVYGSDASVAGSSTSPDRYNGAAMGNSTHGIFIGGSGPGGYAGNADRYNYADNVRTAGTSLAVPRNSLGAFSNQEYGMVCGGTNGAFLNTVEKYTFASAVVTGGTAMSFARGEAGCASNPTYGLMAGGQTSAIVRCDKYSFSAGTWAQGTNLTAPGRAFNRGASSNPGNF